MILAILFWSIFYQNLPDNFGLNGTKSDGLAGSVNILDRTIKICMFATNLYVIATRWSVARSFAKHLNVGAVAFLGLAGLSTVWSIDSSATMLRFTTLMSAVLMCFSISLVGWHRQRFQQLAIPPLMVILVVSLVLGIIFPDRIIEVGDDLSLKNAWHGIVFSKNQFGIMASFGVVICIHRWLAREGKAHWTIAGAAVASACLILSRSNTSEFAALLGVLFMLLVMRVPVIKQRYSTHVVVAIASIIILYALVIQDLLPGAHTLLAPIRGLTGKNGTFSARTIIWDIVKEHIQHAPYLGSGYGAYWVGPVANSPSYVFTYLMYFYPTESHNGYLETVNDLGYVGLICLLAFLFSYMRQGIQLLRVDRNQAALYLALLFQQMVVNLSESEWFARDSIFAVLFLAATCLSRGLYESRRQVRSAAQAAR